MERHVARAKGSLSKASVASGHDVRGSAAGGGTVNSPSLSSGVEGTLPHAQSTPVVQVSKSVFATPRNVPKDTRRPTAEDEDLPRRERDFLFYFGHLKEKLIDHTSCACQGEDDMLVRHGRIFITENHICFSSHIIGEYLKEIPFAGVQQIAKKNTAFVVPNAISVKHTHGTEFFSSMSGRDRIFDLLNTLWHKKQGEKSLGINLKSLTESARLESAKKKGSNAENLASSADNPFRTSGKQVPKAAPSISVSPPSDAQLPKRKSITENTDIVAGMEEEESQRGRKSSKPLDLSIFKNSMGGEEGGALKSPRSPRLSLGVNEEEKGVSGEGEGKKEQKENNGGTDWVEGKKVNFNEDALRGSGLAIGGKSPIQMGKLPPFGEYDGHLHLPEKIGQELLLETLPCAKVSRFYVSLLFNANKFWNVLLRKAGYFNIQVQQWQEAGPHHYARALSMTAPLRSFPGLGHVRIRQEHQLSSPRSGLLVFDIRSKTEGETYSGTYEIWSRWEIEEREGQCVVSVRQHTEHLKKTWVAHVLEGNARDQTVIFLHKWLLRAREQLKNEENDKLEAEKKRNALLETAKNVSDSNGSSAVGAGESSNKSTQASSSDSGGGIDIGAILDTFPLPSMESLMETSVTLLYFALIALFLIFGALYLSYSMSSAQHRLQETSGQFTILDERAKFLLSFSARTQGNINALRSSDALSDPQAFSDALAASWQEGWLPLEASWEVEEWQRVISIIGSDVARVAHTMSKEMADLSNPSSLVSPAEHLHRISGSHQTLLRALEHVRLSAPPVVAEGYSYITLLATLGTVAVGVLYAAYA